MNFHHLDIPRPSNNNAWIVLATNDMFLILLKSGILEYGPDHMPKEYLFSSETDAHFAAARYYNDNKGLSYPYIDRLIELTNSTTMSDRGKVQSTPMRFK